MSKDLVVEQLFSFYTRKKFKILYGVVDDKSVDYLVLKVIESKEPSVQVGNTEKMCRFVFQKALESKDYDIGKSKKNLPLGTKTTKR